MGYKYVARVDGVVVAKRATAHRQYTHAVVVKVDLQVLRARPAAYYENGGHAKYNYEILQQVAMLKPGEKLKFSYYNADSISRAKRMTARGYEGYLECVREEEIAAMDKKYGVGGIGYRCAGWAGRPYLAQKLAASTKLGAGDKEILILPAEVV